MTDDISNIAAKLSAAFNTDTAYCSRCEKPVNVYTKVKRDTRHAGLWYKIRTTYCVECDADLNHETLDSGRR